MPISLPSKSNLTEGLARVSASEIAELLRDLTAERAADPSLDERVYETRKTIKRLRALLRLYRGALDPALFVREDARLGELGRSLGRARDSVALRESLERLVTGAQGDSRARLSDELPSLAALVGDAAPPASEAEGSLDAVHDA